ncbi:hypothetical protein BGZ61DRAFT_462517 [Ilyonectria robusta]|uniref:uncharacterized protein n=1 Tax=Ilyonectria robusta TaxID=1079257 RepID=UPI001E8E9B45|nr:uncharacterized protein BGZ61DRAFT_462517 [Ilyonectria robusta]KAH8664934.1 hypothetical protein BGZ61DRAFT_462517 [Ilyonectria robusta]
MGMITRQILPSIIHPLHPQRYFKHHLSCPRIEPLFRPATAQALAGVLVPGRIEMNILLATALPTRPCFYYHLWCSSLAHFAEFPWWLLMRLGAGLMAGCTLPRADTLLGDAHGHPDWNPHFRQHRHFQVFELHNHHAAHWKLQRSYFSSVP